jgi:hypothetical protein
MLGDTKAKLSPIVDNSIRVYRSTLTIIFIDSVQNSIVFWCHQVTLYIKSDLCIPRTETAQPRSQFLYSCICQRFIYFQDRSPIWLE